MARRFPVLFTLAALAGALTACATPPGGRPAATVVVETPEPWRVAAQDRDAALIDALPATFARALAQVPARQRAAVQAEGPLLVADAALDHPQLPPGSYTCRVVRVGAIGGRSAVRGFPGNFCYIKGEDDGTLTLTKQTGSDLPAGRLYPAGERRYIFLGARQARVGDNSLAYGDRRDRDVAAVVERVGAFRWRMVAPSRDGRALDVYELTPVPADRQPS